jgi:hypothetical protein
MGQSFLCESFSSKIDKTRRKNETIHQSIPTSMDYEKQSGSQDSQPDGSQRLRCTLCPGIVINVISPGTHSLQYELDV